MTAIVRPLLVACVLCAAAPAEAQMVTFDAGTLIIPMDVDYQDTGMLKAFGLLDSLLRAGITVSWCIKTPKAVVDAANGRFESDFTAAATDFQSGNAVKDLIGGAMVDHAYRGGPFVVAQAEAAAAAPIVKAWQLANTTAVHVASTQFSAPVSKTLTAAPRIAVFGDGNEGIAFNYLNAAGIPDENGSAWGKSSPDLLTPSQVAGPDLNNPHDGALFRASGQPAFCEIMTMHWNVNDQWVPSVVPEMGSFLQFPVHLNAECQAVNAIEGAPPVGGRSKFVAPLGFVWPAPQQPQLVQFSSSELPFAQMDGPFGTIGGSEPAYALPMGTQYYDSGIVMVHAAGKALGVQDVWMTGYAGGGCPIGQECNAQGLAKGKVSYLGGHNYSVNTPMSKSPQSQGTRLFLNSLYEAGCVDGEGQPLVTLTKAAPATTAVDTITYTISYSNSGGGAALGLTISDKLPAGASFVSASMNAMPVNGVVSWTIGDVPTGGNGMVTLTVKLAAFGTYKNYASTAFSVGLNQRQINSNTTTTLYAMPPPPDMAIPVDMSVPPDLAPPPDLATADLLGCGAGCPAPKNPCLKAACVQGKCVDVNNDGARCGATDKCHLNSVCVGGACQSGMPVVCPPPRSPCEQTMCDPMAGCGYAPTNEGMPCPPPDKCTMATTCSMGQCAGGLQVVCPRLRCMIAVCDPMAGCQSSPVDRGTDPFNECVDIGNCVSNCDGKGGCAPICAPPDLAMGSDLLTPMTSDGGAADLAPVMPNDLAAEPDGSSMAVADAGSGTGMDSGDPESGDLAPVDQGMTLDDLANSGVIDDLGTAGNAAEMGDTQSAGAATSGCGCRVASRGTSNRAQLVFTGVLMAAVLLRLRRRRTLPAPRA